MNLHLNRRHLAVLVFAAPALLLQGSCQTTDWQCFHSPYGGETATASATLLEHYVEVTPPNPPLTWDYTVTVTEVPLETKDMDAQYAQLPFGSMYTNHSTEFGPHLPDASALTFARYREAYEIRMTSAGNGGSGPYVTTDTNKPSDWATCTP